MQGTIQWSIFFRVFHQTNAHLGTGKHDRTTKGWSQQNRRDMMWSKTSLKTSKTYQCCIFMSKNELLSNVYVHWNSIWLSLKNITHSNCNMYFSEPQVTVKIWPTKHPTIPGTLRSWDHEVRLHSESWDFGIKGVFKNTAKSLLRKTPTQK